ncbi:hypothetical protein Leryth_020535 [Lithospermum erythrorhizon]|nr:hypothetical protein Leryth_020535 [Lithospermum erythrorhizon]
MHYANYYFNTFKKLFADLILSFYDKRNSQSFFKSKSWDKVFFMVEVELGLIYDLLYTKASLIHSPVGGFLRCFTLASTIIVFVSFLICDRSSLHGIEIQGQEADKKSWLYDFDIFKERPLSRNDDENYYKFIRKMSKWLSDYMFYLLIVCPFMLPSGIGQIRFEDTRAEAMEFLEEGKRARSTDIKDSCCKLLDVNTDHKPSEVKGDRSKSVLFDACRLVHSLNNSNQHDKRKQWETIFNAWVDILCYAAAECNWSDHADQLRRGGELLTHVWLLMAHFGMTAQFQISRGYVRAKWQLD